MRTRTHRYWGKFMEEPISLATGDVVERRVLVVEDVETTRRRIAQVLRTHGYQVEEALDGLEALRKVTAVRFDAILLDLVLPHVDGWQFRATQLRHTELADIPTIVVTVRPLRPSDRYALKYPTVVQKPFEDEALLAAVETACSTARRASEQVRLPAQVTQLFWSRRGEIGCADHAPASTSERWRNEGWVAIPADAERRQIVYQCQHCPGHKGPIARPTRSKGPKP